MPIECRDNYVEKKFAMDTDLCIHNLKVPQLNWLSCGSFAKLLPGRMTRYGVTEKA